MSVSQPAGAGVAMNRMKFEHPEGPVYKRPFGCMQNRAVQKEIESLDPVKDCQRIAYLMVSYEFPQEIEEALNMAYFGSGATKAVADILGRSDFKANAMKRYDDTRFLIWKFMESGWDKNQGHRAIMHMNKIHGHYKIRNWQFSLALCAFINAPLAWIDNFGWRKMTKNERLGWFNFWLGVGKLMEIEKLPESEAEARQWMEEYFGSNTTEFSEFSPAIGESQFKVFVERAPWYAKPFKRYYLQALMTPPLAQAYGIRYIPLAGKLPVVLYLKLNGLRRKFFSAYMFPYFIDREPTLKTYPQGTPVVEDAGPTYIVNRIKEKAAKAAAVLNG